VFHFSGLICIFPNAVSQFAQPPVSPAIPKPLRPYRDRFRLFVLTRYYPHKNLEALVDMYAAFADELRDALCVLTIDGSQHPRAPRLLEQIRRLGLNDLILNVGPLPQEELAEYYLACDALLLPTLLESFSGTYLEAMHFGRPILTSDLDFAREVCADAAMYFDPWQPVTIKDAIVRLRDDEALRKDLVARGQARLQQTFRSWGEVVSKALSDLGIPHG